MRLPIENGASLRSDGGGNFALESPATLAWIGWQLSCGLGGNFGVDWVATLAWIGWQNSVEYAFRDIGLWAGGILIFFARNMLPDFFVQVPLTLGRQSFRCKLSWQPSGAFVFAIGERLLA